MKSVLEVMESTTDFFRRRGVPQPRLQIELLLAHVLKIPRMQLYLQFDRPLSEGELDVLRPLVKRRGGREPLQHILGCTGFGHLDLTCDARALIPRPETEVLVEWVGDFLQLHPGGPVVDVGTGTGAIVLALALQMPGRAWWGVDCHGEALDLARENAVKCGVTGVRWAQGDLLQPVEGPIFAVVSNPPYLTPGEIEKAEPEVRHDPRKALDGGEDGLEVVRALVDQAAGRTDHLFLEVGAHHAGPVELLLRAAGFGRVETRQDLAGVPRFIAGHRDG